MKSRALTVCLFLCVVAVGCSSTASVEQTAAPTTSSTSTIAPTTASTSETTTTSAPAPSTTTAVVGPLDDDNYQPVSVAFPIPAGLFIEDVASVERPVIHGFVDNGTGGGNQESLLWAVDQPFASAVAVESLFPENDFAPVITDLLELNGEYFAFLMGDSTSDPRAPTMLRSADGINWTAEPLGPLLQRASFRAAAFTPPSPPFPGASGVVDALVHGTTIVATGWSTVGEDIVPTVWKYDGAIWSAQVIEIENAFGNLYGSQIATTDRGLIVRLGGPVHTGVATMVEVAGGWEPAEPFDESFSPELVAGNGLYLYRLVLPVVEGGPPTLLWSEDRSEWFSERLPVVEGSDPFSWKVEASSWHDPVLWQTNFDAEDPIATIWTLDRGRWEEATLAGFRIVGVDEELLTTQDDQQLYVVDRRGPDVAISTGL